MFLNCKRQRRPRSKTSPESFYEKEGSKGNSGREEVVCKTSTGIRVRHRHYLNIFLFLLGNLDFSFVVFPVYCCFPNSFRTCTNGSHTMTVRYETLTCPSLFNNPGVVGTLPKPLSLFSISTGTSLPLRV